MELKYLGDRRRGRGIRSFNRTIVELKLNVSWSVAISVPPFNRTIVELKFSGEEAAILAETPF